MVPDADQAGVKPRARHLNTSEFGATADATKAPPTYAVPTVEGSTCPVAATGPSIRAAPEEAPWGQLQQLARQYGWPV